MKNNKNMMFCVLWLEELHFLQIFGIIHQPITDVLEISGINFFITTDEEMAIKFYMKLGGKRVGKLVSKQYLNEPEGKKYYAIWGGYSYTGVYHGSLHELRFKLPYLNEGYSVHKTFKLAIRALCKGLAKRKSLLTQKQDVQKNNDESKSSASAEKLPSGFPITRNHKRQGSATCFYPVPSAE